ncbi:MAG: M1 family metallopeptidase [Acidobacteria bacterium]|nr:M1 family metallopeptidase [Acidobacteriota bacterium]
MRPCPRATGALVVVLAVGAGSGALAQVPSRSARVVDYRIEASLDPSAHRVDGRQRLTWRNPSSTDTVGEVWFHLYLNAFRNSQSTFLRERPALRASMAGTDDAWGSIVLTSFRLAGGADLTNAVRFADPRGINPDDRTLVRVPLPRPVPPRGTAVFEIDFVARLPKVVERTGHAGDFHMVAQWFPKIAVYEPAGRRGRTDGGWNAHQFHANAEFYSDFGRYEVALTVPSRFTVGATGVRTARVDHGDGTVTSTYVQEDVHDFAWTADPNLVELRETFSATADVSPAEYEETAALLGRSVEELRLSDVEIILLVQPLHRRQANRYFAAAKLALKWFGLWYGRYPYRTLTIVDPPRRGAGAAGMEYPTLVTGGTLQAVGYWPLSGLRMPEVVTVHEVGHQFWQGLVANHEGEEAWLDEGLTSYVTGKALERAFGRDATYVDLPGLRAGVADLARMGNTPWRRFARIRQPSWSYDAGYGFYSYQKPELALRTLEYLLGSETMARVMRAYHERWRFGHPSGDDFLAVVREVAGGDLDGFFSQVFDGYGVLDYEVAAVSTERVAPAHGLFDDGRLVSRRAAQQEADRRPLYESTVVVRRLGEVIVPTHIALKFEGREPERLAWDGQAPRKRFTFTRPERLEWADVDPDRGLWLDVNWLNNARRVEPDRRAPTIWTARWMLLMQYVFTWLGL